MNKVNLKCEAPYHKIILAFYLAIDEAYLNLYLDISSRLSAKFLRRTSFTWSQLVTLLMLVINLALAFNLLK